MTVHNRSIIKNIVSLYNFSVGSYIEYMEENFKVSSKSVDSGRWSTPGKKIIYGIVKPKLARTIAELALSHNIK